MVSCLVLDGSVSLGALSSSDVRRKSHLDYVLSNSFGFGGNNATILLSKVKGEQ